MYLKYTLFISTLSYFLFTSCNNDDDNKSNNKQIQNIEFSGPVYGCADFNIQKESDSTNSRIALRINGSPYQDLGLDSTFQSFSLPNPDLDVKILEWDGLVGEQFCNDVIVNEPPILNSLSAVSGTIQLKISDLDTSDVFDTYKISVILENIILNDSTESEQVTISELILEDVFVGWLPG